MSAARSSRWRIGWRGATTILHRAFEPAEVLRAIGEDRVTAAHLAPTMVARLLEHPDLAATDRSSLRIVHYASAPMAVPLLRRAIEAFGPVFLQVYGMTECITVSVLKPFQHVLDGAPAAVKRLSSAGQPVFGVRIRCVAAGWQRVRGGASPARCWCTRRA